MTERESEPEGRAQAGTASRRTLALALAFVGIVSLGASILPLSSAHGWPSADAVEYLEHARSLVVGEELVDAQAIRPQGVALLYTPLFLVGRLTGDVDAAWIGEAAQVMAALLAAVAAVVSALLARRLVLLRGDSEASAGLVAGTLAGLALVFNPVVLRHAALPVADIAAAIAVALGVLALLAPRRPQASPFRRGFRVGGAAGLALLAAYKTLPLGVLLVLAVGLSEGWARDEPRSLRTRAGRGFGALAGGGLAFALVALVQCALDTRIYGSFGGGLVTYFGSNAGPLLGSYLLQLGQRLDSELLKDAATNLYAWGTTLLAERPLDVAAVSRDAGDLRDVQGTYWYFERLSSLFTWPMFGLVVAGGAAAVRRRGAWVVVLLILAYVLVTSSKGAKELRLWLPILPLALALAGLGGQALAGTGRSRLRASAVAGLFALGALGSTLSVRTELDGTSRAFDAFARAVEWAGANVALAEREAGAEHDGRVALAASYHWAVLLQHGETVDLVKLPHQLDRWSALDEAQRTEDLAALDGREVLIVHHALLTAPDHNELHAWIAERFTVAAAFWDRAANPHMGPILVLVRAGHPAASRQWLVRKEIPAPDTPLATRAGLSFERGDLGERLSLLGWEFTRLPGDGLAWLELTLRADVGAIAGGPEGAATGGYQLRTRLEESVGRWSVDAVRPFGRNLAPSGSWPRGQVLVDAWIVDPKQGTPYEWPERAGPPAGARGAAQVELWVDVFTREFAPEGVRVNGRLELVLAGAGHAERDDVPDHVGVSDDGWAYARDGAVRIATFSIPGAPGAHVSGELGP